MRTFKTGATRNDDTDKLDYDGFLSHTVLKRYAEYMHKHRRQEDGTMRASDNWKKGIDKSAYMKSGWRHFHEWWGAHTEGKTRDEIEEIVCAVMFNAMGYLHESLKENKEQNGK